MIKFSLISIVAVPFLSVFLGICCCKISWMLWINLCCRLHDTFQPKGGKEAPTVSLLVDKSSPSAIIDSRWVIGRWMESDGGRRGTAVQGWGSTDRWRRVMDGWLNKCRENRKLHPSGARRGGGGRGLSDSAALWRDKQLQEHRTAENTIIHVSKISH